jgi:hypothetical protein
MKRTVLCLVLCVSAAVLLAPNVFALSFNSTSAGDGWQSSWSADNNGGPYWDNASYEGSAAHENNIGFYMTQTGDQQTGAGNGNGQSGGNNGPGAHYSYWGSSSGAADPNLFFSGASSVTVTFKDAYSNQDGKHTGISADSFGWFTTSASGSTRGANNVLFGATAHTAGDSATFTLAPGQNFGFYLDNVDRGTFNTLNTFDVANPYYTSWPKYQHFSVFQQDANTMWIGVEDLITNLGNGVGGVGDADYNDFIVEITTTPSTAPDGGSTLLLLGFGLMGLWAARTRFATAR